MPRLPPATPPILSILYGYKTKGELVWYRDILYFLLEKICIFSQNRLKKGGISMLSTVSTPEFPLDPPITGPLIFIFFVKNSVNIRLYLTKGKSHEGFRPFFFTESCESGLIPQILKSYADKVSKLNSSCSYHGTRMIKVQNYY